MTKIRSVSVLLASIAMLASCAYTCSGEFEQTNEHMWETAQNVYSARELGKITATEAATYQLEIEQAYVSTVEGSKKCEEDEAAAIAILKKADADLAAIDNELK